MPLWEDLIAKATKLHSTLKATILAVTAYLEAFQKIADAATNARGATREIGTALTRICLRHKAVETRMKTFTSTIMEYLVLPLQEKLEDWRKTVINLDKEHARDYKRARTELKKRSTDTLRLQKKMRKGAGGDLQKRLEYGLQDVNERKHLMEETEKHAVRAALVEERSRFCIFVGFLKPVVDEEVAMLSELSRLQEVVVQLEKHTAEPQSLPPASEQVLADLKCSDAAGTGGWSFQQTPPSSPSSLGSRKSSMCSISSLNSSSSGSSKSPAGTTGGGHPHWQRSLSQPVGRSGTMRLSSVSSRDSGFTSQDSLYPRPPSSFSVAQVSNMSEGNSSSSSTPCTPFPPGGAIVPTTTSTWPNLQESIQFERAASAIINDRPHTISSAYEKGTHQRPPLTVYTFQSPSNPLTEHSLSQPVSPVTATTVTSSSSTTTTPTAPPTSPAPSLRSQHQFAKPPLPTRCSSLERPSVPAKATALCGVRVLPVGVVPTPLTVTSQDRELQQHKVVKPTSLPPHIMTKSMPQPTYVNMHELASMAASKAQEMSLPPPPAEFTTVTTPGGGAVTSSTEPAESSTSESSLESSSGYGSQTTFPSQDTDNGGHQQEDLEAVKYCTLPRNTAFSANAQRRRPLSMTAVYAGGTLRPLLRRGSVQTNKPPPPIRRTASITNTNTIGHPPPGIAGGGMRPLTPVEHLPPPPAFLLEPATTVGGGGGGHKPGVNVAETIKALTEQRHTPASPNAIRRSSVTQSIYQTTGLQHLHNQLQGNIAPPPETTGNIPPGGINISPLPATPILSSFQSGGGGGGGVGGASLIGTKLSYLSQSSGVIYAQPSLLLGPGSVSGGSPSAVRRIHSIRSQSAERKCEGPGGVGSNFIAALSAKLAPNLSPRSSRRHSEDLAKPVQNKGPGHAFLESLNAKLTNQHISSPQRASKIRQIINNKALPDPKICHDSLMDQIKQGATLKRAKIINDRSAPKIY